MTAMTPVNVSVPTPAASPGAVPCATPAAMSTVTPSAARIYCSRVFPLPVMVSSPAIPSKNSSGQIPNQTEVPAGSHAGKVASHQTGTATEHASADSAAGKMVAAGRHRLLQLPRGADKQFDTDRVPIPRHQSLAAHATAAEPERLDDLGADQAVGRRLAPETANPSSVARESLRR